MAGTPFSFRTGRMGEPRRPLSTPVQPCTHPRSSTTRSASIRLRVPALVIAADG
ncbi:hypothetical protein [Streptomyces chrestomyceticus]|uniref:hypothetical protein n=1 Tax=Streptomyces chrestomyceticus TaxID=68185 RepID=UPI003F4D2608